VREAPHKVHVVLHDENRFLQRDAVQHFAHARGFVIGHAGGGFIEQQQVGVLHQEHSDFEPLLGAVRQRAGSTSRCSCRPIRSKYSLRRSSRSRSARARSKASTPRSPRAANVEIIGHAERSENRRRLELAPDAQLRNLVFLATRYVTALEEHAPARRPHTPADAVEQGSSCRRRWGR
jgi:hypothetical protein